MTNGTKENICMAPQKQIEESGMDKGKDKLKDVENWSTFPIHNDRSKTPGSDVVTHETMRSDEIL